DALQSLRALGGQGSMARDLPCAGRRRGPAGGGADRLFCRESSPLRLGWKRGEHNQAIGRSRGGRTTKIHALTDIGCRPIAFLLTGGSSADLVHLKGLGFWLCRSMKARISAFNCLTEVWTPRRSRFLASSANQRST